MTFIVTLALPGAFSTLAANSESPVKSQPTAKCLLTATPLLQSPSPLKHPNACKLFRVRAAWTLLPHFRAPDPGGCRTQFKPRQKPSLSGSPSSCQISAYMAKGPWLQKPLELGLTARHLGEVCNLIWPDLLFYFSEVSLNCIIWVVHKLRHLTPKGWGHLAQKFPMIYWD